MTRRSILRALPGAALFAAGARSACARDSVVYDGGMSPVKLDETVTFFASAASPAADAPGAWDAEICGIIYELERRRLLGPLMVKALRIDTSSLLDEERSILNERLRLFLADNERGKKIPVRFAGGTHILPRSSPNGHFRDTLRLSPEQVALAQHGKLPVEVITREGDNRKFGGEILLMGDGDAPCVVSDIDDTIKISEVLDRKALIRNTFCRPFSAVPDMAGLYQEWSTAGAVFHYVTGSPWHLYLPLELFLRKNDFPAGAWHMKHFRLKDPSTVIAMLRSQLDYKLGRIEPLLKRWPRRRFVLVGDSGEQDPEVFGELARRYPDRISRIFIRNLQPLARTDVRLDKAFGDVRPEVWQLFRNAEELPRVV